MQNWRSKDNIYTGGNCVTIPLTMLRLGNTTVSKTRRRYSTVRSLTLCGPEQLCPADGGSWTSCWPEWLWDQSLWLNPASLLVKDRASYSTTLSAHTVTSPTNTRNDSARHFIISLTLIRWPKMFKSHILKLVHWFLFRSANRFQRGICLHGWSV